MTKNSKEFVQLDQKQEPKSLLTEQLREYDSAQASKERLANLPFQPEEDESKILDQSNSDDEFEFPDDALQTPNANKDSTLRPQLSQSLPIDIPQRGNIDMDNESLDDIPLRTFKEQEEYFDELHASKEGEFYVGTPHDVLEQRKEARQKRFGDVLAKYEGKEEFGTVSQYSTTPKQGHGDTAWQRHMEKNEQRKGLSHVETQTLRASGTPEQTIIGFDI